VLSRVQPEGAGVADAPDLKVAGVLRRQDPAGIGTGRRDPARGGGFVRQGFVRAQFVVGVPEGIEDALLEVAVGRRGLGRARLEGFVQALISISFAKPLGGTTLMPALVVGPLSLGPSSQHWES
jgi:hypothetical protein